MTAQIPDSFYYKSEEYRLIKTSASFGFCPKAFGIETVHVTTACWRGFVATYEIRDDKFLLTKVELSLKGDAPEIYGVKPNVIRCSSGMRFGMLSTYQEVGEDDPDAVKEVTYEHIDKILEIDGSIILARDVIREFKNSDDYMMNAPWHYKQIFEFHFEKGCLVRINDRSAEAEDDRQQIDAGKSPKNWLADYNTLDQEIYGSISPNIDVMHKNITDLCVPCIFENSYTDENHVFEFNYSKTEIFHYPNNGPFRIVFLAERERPDYEYDWNWPFPLMEGIPQKVKFKKIFSRFDGDAIVDAELPAGAIFSFTHPFLFRESDKCDVGKEAFIELAGLALKCKPSDGSNLKIETGPVHEKALKNFLGDFSDKTEDDFAPPEVPMQGDSVFVPGFEAGTWLFKSTILERDGGGRVLGEWINKYKITIPDADGTQIPFYLHVPEAVMSDNVQIGDIIEGELHFTGYINGIPSVKPDSQKRTKEELTERLTVISEKEAPHIAEIDYPLCWHRSFPDEKRVFKCPQCGKQVIEEYTKQSLFDDIQKTVGQIRKLGYDAQVREVCPDCAGVVDVDYPYVVIQFLFRFDENVEYTVTNCNDEDRYQILLAFLYGFYDYKARLYLYFLCDYIEEIEQMLGLYVEDYERRGWKKQKQLEEEQRLAEEEAAYLAEQQEREARSPVGRVKALWNKIFN